MKRQELRTSVGKSGDSSKCKKYQFRGGGPKRGEKVTGEEERAIPHKRIPVNWRRESARKKRG